MIRKNLFKKLGGFNEEYESELCTLELSLNCLVNGYINYCDGSLVAKTENTINQNNSTDYKLRLQPFIHGNINKIKKYIKPI